MRSVIALITATLLTSFVRLALGDAKLLNFETAHRVPGEYYVVLKTGKELESVPRSGPRAPLVSPQIVPNDEATVMRLGRALAKSIGARFGGVSVSQNHKAFIVTNASERNIRSVLAKDPRIAEISPGIKIEAE
jgi:hypothetical protein